MNKKKLYICIDKKGVIQLWTNDKNRAITISDKYNYGVAKIDMIKYRNWEDWQRILGVKENK